MLYLTGLKDLDQHIFSFLPSLMRSGICSVSKLFLDVALDVSKSLSGCPELYDNSVQGSKLSPKEIELILQNDNHHLFTRLKFVFPLEEICKTPYIHNMNVVYLMVNKGSNDWDPGLLSACLAGNIYTVKLILAFRSSTDYIWDELFANSCKSGNIKVVKMIINQTTDHLWDNNLYHACFKGDIAIINLTINKGELSGHNYKWDEGLCGACYGGHINIVDFMIKKGATDWNTGMSAACSGGHLDIVNLMIEKGANSFHTSFWGIYSKNEETNWDRGLGGACEKGCGNIIKLMIDKGAICCPYCGWNKKQYIPSKKYGMSHTENIL